MSLLLLTAGCSISAQSDIRKVDLKNFTYEPACTGEKPEKVTVKDGEISREKQEAGYVDRFFFKVFNITYGDVTGDGIDDAVVLSTCNTGGTGNFTEGWVISMRGGRPGVTAHIPGGDRAEGGLRDAQIEGGQLIIRSNDPGEGGGACCPQVVVTTRYKVINGKLSQVGKEERRDLFPRQLVAFARGASSASIELTIPAEEGKRLVVGARAGQTLTVTINTDKISTGLLEEADITETTGGFVAKLPKGGDYTIQLTNYEEAPVKGTVTIRIN